MSADDAHVVAVEFDPELAVALPAIHEVLLPDAVRPGTIGLLRGASGVIAAPSWDELIGDDFDLELLTLVVPDEEAPTLPVAVCTPRGTTPSAIVFHIHGGGMVAGDLRNGLQEALSLASELCAAVVSVDYRLAPETTYPGAIEDCAVALEWTFEHAGDLVGSAVPIVLLGASAGGGLAAATLLRARDLGLRLPHAAMLIAPMLDDRNNTFSARQMEGLGVWDRTSNATGWAAYLGDLEEVPTHAAPARESDLSRLPPLYLDVGSAETFRDEVVAFAETVWRSGGDAELHVWPGAFHAFDALVPDARLSRDAVRARIAWLRRVLT